MTSLLHRVRNLAAAASILLLASAAAWGLGFAWFEAAHRYLGGARKYSQFVAH